MSRSFCLFSGDLLLERVGDVSNYWHVDRRDCREGLLMNRLGCAAERKS